MTILYVNDSLAIWGGIERVLVDKMNYLADVYDYNVHIVTVDQGQHPIPYSLNPKVSFHDLGILFYQKYKYRGIKRVLISWKLQRLYVSRLKNIISQIRPDVISCARQSLLGSVLKAKGCVPIIFESHTSCYSYRFEVDCFLKRLRELFYVYQVRKVNMVVALTEGDAFDWMRYNKNVDVIPNIVHLNDKGKYSECLNKTVIYVGRFSKQKDIGSLLEIWRIVYQKYPEWQLHIYGGYGDQSEQLMPILKQCISYNIYVHDPSPNIFDEYINSSMLLLTSLYEPFGLVIPEAMSCGLPVVSFDCPYGPASILTDGENGYLIKNRNINAYADKVCALIENKTMRMKMGKAAILDSQKYGAHSIMPQWISLFERIKKE